MDPNKTWQKILENTKNQISPTNFRGWFSQTKLAQIQDDKVQIFVPSAFIKNQMTSRYNLILKDIIVQVTGKVLDIEYIIDSSKFEKKSAEQAAEGEEEPDDFFKLTSPSSPTTITLNPKYTLQNFVVGLTNNLAYAAAQAIVQNPGISYNPLFIYGPSGVGKTHLMQGIGNALIQKNPRTKIIFVSSERFMVDFVESIQTKRMGQFRQKYRACDMLLIDDIQFISGKDSMQEEFFHTYNELHSKNSQLIFSSDRPPMEIQKLESRLLSRFQGGLMVDIQPPDFDTRVAILKAKLKERGEKIEEGILELIAENVTSNTRELEGKLIQIVQIAKLQNITLDLDFVKKTLGKPLNFKAQTPDHKKVLSTINQYFNLKMVDLAGPRRQKGLVLPRQIAMFILYEDCKIPMEKIGQILGGRDHTTVLHGVEKIREAVLRDREIQRLVGEIKNQLG